MKKTFLTCDLPLALRPSGSFPLVRLGSQHDGGYLVDLRALNGTGVLLSAGVNDDWCFERDFYEKGAISVVACDGSVGLNKFRRVFYKRVLNPIKWFKPKKLYRGWNRYEEFKNFFHVQPGVRFEEKYLSRHVGPMSLSLTELVNRVRHQLTGRGLYLKLDIEGAEYEVLDEIVDFSNLYSGLSIEFHDVAARIDQICQFVDRLRMNLCWVHVNNYCKPISGGLPDAIELSFSSFSPISDHCGFESKANRANNPERLDYVVRWV
jgi:hypothetical protein